MTKLQLTRIVRLLVAVLLAAAISIVASYSTIQPPAINYTGPAPVAHVHH